MGILKTMLFHKVHCINESWRFSEELMGFLLFTLKCRLLTKYLFEDIKQTNNKKG